MDGEEQEDRQVQNVERGEAEVEMQMDKYLFARRSYRGGEVQRRLDKLFTVQRLAHLHTAWLTEHAGALPNRQALLFE